MLPEISIERMREKDLDAAMQLKEAEGWNQTMEDWRLLLKENPDLCLVALSRGKVVATVTAITYENCLAWIGMMLVQKDHRGMGISKLLMKHLIQQLDQTAAIKLDATPAGFPVYSKLGFSTEFTIFRMTNPKIKPAAKGKDIARTMKGNDLEAIISYDKAAFGVNRENLIQHLWSSSPDKAWLIEEEGNINGFLLSRPGSKFTQLGPLMAGSVGDAIALLETAFWDLQGIPVVIDVLADKEGVVEWLRTNGFTAQRELIRMYYQENPLPGRIEQQYLISGPELG